MFPLLLVTAQTCCFLSLTLNGLVTPMYFSPRLILPWGKFSSYFHYSLGTALILVSFYPGDHADPQFTVHYSPDTSLTVSHHKTTFFPPPPLLLLSYYWEQPYPEYICFRSLCLGLLQAQGFTRSLTPKLLVPGCWSSQNHRSRK